MVVPLKADPGSSAMGDGLSVFGGFADICWRSIRRPQFPVQSEHTCAIGPTEACLGEVLGMAGEWWKLCFETPSRHPFPEAASIHLAPGRPPSTAGFHHSQPVIHTSPRQPSRAVKNTVLLLAGRVAYPSGRISSRVSTSELCGSGGPGLLKSSLLEPGERPYQ
jgi:hypothetical protein